MTYTTDLSRETLSHGIIVSKKQIHRVLRKLEGRYFWDFVVDFASADGYNPFDYTRWNRIILTLHRNGSLDWKEPGSAKYTYGRKSK